MQVYTDACAYAARRRMVKRDVRAFVNETRVFLNSHCILNHSNSIETHFSHPIPIEFTLHLKHTAVVGACSTRVPRYDCTYLYLFIVCFNHS